MRIRNKAFVISSIMCFCLVVFSFIGCGATEGNDGTGTSTLESESAEGVATDGGSTLNIYCWNTEFEERMTDYYPGYTDNGDGTGKIGNVKVVWTIVPSNDYQPALDEALLLNMTRSADERVDLFLLEADYILKYVDSDYTLDVVGDLGISESELADQYQYTKTIATSQEGKLKGVSWQATPGLFGYRRSIAIDVLGTDDPVVVQNELSDWNGFDHVADLANKKGYHMLSGPVETFRVFSNNVTQTWVDDPSSVSPKIQVDSKLIEWADMCKKYTENGWIGDNEQWTDGWNFDQSAEGKVFGFFMSTWGINFTLVGNAGEEGFGDWAVCEGPAAWYWGGTWISGARGTDNKELVVDIMRKLTCDKDNMVKMSGETQDYTNTVSGMETLAASDYKSDFLSGQNHIKLFSQAAPKIDMSKVGPYDHGLNEVFQKQMGDYIGGKCDKQTAINNFLKNAVVKYPELTYDPITVQ